ncbi:MAG: CopG family ribbon-helix-helix protein [Candidatus Gastranaerophilaceae bacterium]
MTNKAFSLRLPEETKNKLAMIAKATGRTKSFIALSAIEEYVDLQAWQISEIKEALEQINKGEVISHEELRKEWKERLGEGYLD